MKKKWWIAGAVLVVAAGVGGAWFSGAVPGMGAMAKMGDGKKGDKKEPTLEFTAREVAQPQRGSLDLGVKGALDIRAEKVTLDGDFVAPGGTISVATTRAVGGSTSAPGTAAPRKPT